MERCNSRQEMLNFINKFVETESRWRSGNWLKREEKWEIKMPDTKLKQPESLHGTQEGLRNWRYWKGQRYTDNRTNWKKSPEPCPTPGSNMTTNPCLVLRKWQIYSLWQLNQTGPRLEESRRNRAQGCGTNENKGLINLGAMNNGTSYFHPYNLFQVLEHQEPCSSLPIKAPGKLLSQKLSQRLITEERSVPSHSVVSDFLWLQRPWPARLFCPWDSLGKNTGVGCRFPLQMIFPTQGSN